MFRRRHARGPDASATRGGQDAATVATLDDATFSDQTVGRVTIVDFWAPWCGPCLTFASVFEAAAAEHTDPAGRVAFAACNIDENPRTAQRLQIHLVPMLIVFGPHGSELGRVAGALPRHSLDGIIDQLAPLID